MLPNGSIAAPGPSEPPALRPTVLVHGLLSSPAAEHSLVVRLSSWLRDAFPSMYIKVATLETSDRRLLQLLLGSMAPESAPTMRHHIAQVASLLVPLDEQVSKLCAELAADPALARGFNLLAHSQGALVARGFVQRCGAPRVHNFVSIAAPHAGIFGVPWYSGEPRSLRATALAVLDHLASRHFNSPQLHRRLSFAQYWKDPFNLSAYYGSPSFLRDLNNEGPAPDPLYRKRLTALNALVLVGFTDDEVLVPRESATFSFYRENSSEELTPLRASRLYTADLIGLRELDARGTLHEVWESGCNHSGPSRAFVSRALFPHLNNSLPYSHPHATARRLRPLVQRAWSVLRPHDDRHRVDASSDEP